MAAWFHLDYQLSLDFPAELRVLTSQLNYVVLPLLYAALIGAAAQLDLSGARSWLRSKPLVLLGQWSYALYLVHATIIYALIEWLGVRTYSPLNVLWFAGVSVIAIAASAALYSLIEHPIEQRLRAWQRERLAARIRPDAPAAAVERP